MKIKNSNPANSLYFIDSTTHLKKIMSVFKLHTFSPFIILQMHHSKYVNYFLCYIKLVSDLEINLKHLERCTSYI